jgi:hypothetical protein
MKKIGSYSSALPWFVAVLLSALAAGCGGGSAGRDPILGAGAIAALAPTVTAVAPVNNASGVPINNAVINAAFSEAMSPLTGGASMMLTCAAPCANPTGSVALDPTSRIATYNLAPATALAPLTLYTATVTAATSVATGLALANPYVWQFTTGATPDTTRPSVTLTVPGTTVPGPTAGVAANSAITALFTEEVAPATVTPSSFSVSCAAPCISPAGNVSYAVGTRTAVFTPAAALSVGVTYTVTLSSSITDLAGNALAGNQAALPAPSNYVWTFTTVAAAPPAAVAVLSSNPAAAATGVCPDATINASFSVPSGLKMNPLTVNSANFVVTGPAPALTPVTASSVLLDAATGHVATFTPQAALTAGVTYTATIKGGSTGVKDLAIPANAMASNFSWNMTVGSCVVPPVVPAAVALASASTFGNFGGTAGTTNSGTLTVINGDIGTTAVSTAVTGFHDGGPQCIYTETPLNVGTVNGKIYTAAPPPTVGCPTEGTATTMAIAAQARLDAQTAYLALQAMPVGANPGANLAGLTLAPGVYTSPSGSFLIQGGADLTLDAQGNANAVWVFQMATTLTVGGPGAPRSVILAGGAQAKNVFWQVGSAATINAAGGGTMVGTIISQAGAAFSTAGNVAIVTLNGRALSLGASVTLVNTVINVPAP